MTFSKRTWLAVVCCSLVTSLSSVIAHEGEHDSEVELMDDVYTGNGAFRFLANSSWGSLEGRKKIGPTHGGVVIDKSGNIYVSTDASHGILVYDAEGNYLKSLSKNLVGIHSMALREENGEEYLYCAHLKGKSSLGPGRFVKLTLDGEEVLQIPNDQTGEIPRGLKGVTGVAVTNEGEIFLSCGYGSNYILKFDAEGKFLHHFGGKGGKNHLFNRPHGISIDTRYEEPRLLVADREKMRLVHFDLEGKLIAEYATHLRRPCAVSFHGEYCAVAELQGRVTILDKQGTPVAFLGDNPKQEQWAKFGVLPEAQKKGIFSAPHGLSYDKDGNLYVQDWNKSGRLTKLTWQR